MFRQGDVLIIPVEQIPAKAKRVEREQGRVILAHGEATGHAHAIFDADVELFETADAVDRWLRVQSPQGAPVVHDEHAPIVLPKGDYLVRRQVEYSPGAIRQVAD